MKFNVNHNVRVRLTDAGRDYHRKNYDELRDFVTKRRHLDKWHDYTAPTEDGDGWSTWQLWCLMSEFGQYVGNGRRVPFETEIEIIDSSVPQS